MIAYKLFRKKKNGTITSLFINKKVELPFDSWMKAGDYPTKGFARRPGWHCTGKPTAPHLSEKGRVWCKVEITDYTEFNRPVSQGGMWYLAKNIQIIEELSYNDVAEIRKQLT